MRLLRTAFLLAALASVDASARDLSMFGVLRVDLPQPPLETPVPGRWGYNVDLGYQNTWSMSPNVEDYFENRVGQRQFTAADVLFIRSLEGEKFFVDGELGVLDFTVRRQIDSHWGIRGSVGAIAYTGGFMDASIESFHRTFGFRDYLRPAVPRDLFTVMTGFRNGDAQTLLDAPSSGLLDPEVGIRYSWFERPAPWNLVLDAALKIPVGGRRPYLSNGGWDVGAQATLQGVWGKHVGTASASLAYSRGGGVIETSGYRLAPGMTLGYEYAFVDATRGFAQASLYRYPLNSEDTAIGGLRQRKSQIELGFRHRYGDSTFEFSIVEAFGAFNGLPDFGIQLGWSTR